MGRIFPISRTVIGTAQKLNPFKNPLLNALLETDLSAICYTVDGCSGY